MFGVRSLESETAQMTTICNLFQGFHVEESNELSLMLFIECSDGWAVVRNLYKNTKNLRECHFSAIDVISKPKTLD